VSVRFMGVGLVVCAAGGQHEERLVLRSPLRDVVNKNVTEPQAAQIKCIMGYSILVNG